MKANREILEDRLEEYEAELRGINSFITELKAMAAKLGTEPAQVEEDLREAENNRTFYQAEIARLKKELAGSGGGKHPYTGGTRGYQKPTPGVSSILFSAIGFIAGALFASALNSRKDK
jgi:hypothetical protein